MSHKRSLTILGILFILSIVLAISGCTGTMVTTTPTPAATTAPTPTATPTVVPTAVPVATPVPTSVPTPVVTPGPTPTPAPLATPYTLWPYYEYHWSITPTPQPTYDDSTVLLVINGSVNTPLNLTLADLKAYPQYSVTVTIGSTTVSGTGPKLFDLFDDAGPLSNDCRMRSYYSGGIATSIDLNSLNSAGLIIIAIDSNNNLDLILDSYSAYDERLTNVTALTIVMPPA